MDATPDHASPDRRVPDRAPPDRSDPDRAPPDRGDRDHDPADREGVGSPRGAPRRRAAVVTASDGVASGHREDGSGDAVAAQLTGAGFEVVARVVVPDERGTIATRLASLVDEGDLAVVAITGGTGFGPRDVTPEATEDVLDRRAPGLAEAMRAAGRASTPMADLSRGVCGIRGRTLLLDLPGSPRGATESLAAVLDLLPHAVDLLAGDTRRHPPGHGEHGRPAPTGAGTPEDHTPPTGAGTPEDHDHDHVPPTG